jgi:uncharacterized membrane protein YkvA (DUF1232 family)
MASREPSGYDENFFQEWWTNLRLAWKLLTDRRVDMVAKIIPLLGLIYVVSPIDILPDLIPVLGQLDDVAIILLAVRFFINMCPPEVVAGYRAQLEGHDVVDADWRPVDPEERR